MKNLGLFLFVVGVVWMFNAYNMDTTVTTESRTIGSGEFSVYVPSVTVNNLGKMDERRNNITLAGVIIVVASILYVAGKKSQSSKIATASKVNFPASPDDFESKWETLVKYDEATSKAVERLTPFGFQAIDELKKAHRAIGDPSQLHRIAETIAQEIEDSRDETKQMIKHRISKDGEKYLFSGFRYDKLADAVAYAKRSSELS